MSEKISSCPSLYIYSLKEFVNQMDLTVKSLDKMQHLRLLPPTILSDIYREVSFLKVENENSKQLLLSLTQKNFHFSFYNKINLDLCCWSVGEEKKEKSDQMKRKTLRERDASKKRRLKNKKRYAQKKVLRAIKARELRVCAYCLEFHVLCFFFYLHRWQKTIDFKMFFWLSSLTSTSSVNSSNIQRRVVIC
jgi:hypothetical protein